ncbi:MAG: hypothetical protein M1305_00825 [Candidatus Marsarchaeota archaeon]|nr:hypothetical protein [Candidatus Marsarchaeota archaeon]
MCVKSTGFYTVHLAIYRVLVIVVCITLECINYLGAARLVLPVFLPEWRYDILHFQLMELEEGSVCNGRLPCLILVAPLDETTHDIV